jgi:hypothetical protein
MSMVRKMFFSMSLTAATIFSVNAATVRGVVEDNANNPAPIAGAVVSFTSTGGGSATEYSDTTDTTGSYRITINNNGTYDIAVTKTGYTPDPGNDPSVTIRNSTNTVVVDLVMTPRSSGTTVSGVVTDSLSNAFLIGAKLLLQQSAFNGWRTIDSTVSITGGAYAFDSITSGTYRIQASLTGYLLKTTGITVRTAADTVNIKLVAVVTVNISGTITDSLSNANLSGALLILQQMTTGGWRAVDSVTSGNGAYAFADVEANTYRIQASLTGYSSKTTANITVTGAQNQTMNIKLLATQTGKIIGKVTGDSATGAAISGATVILERVSGATIAIDTVITDASGIYLFNSVETGLNYDITASKNGYTERTVRHSRQNAGTDTVNIALQKIATGSVYVKVMKQTDSAAITGASVTITATGGVLVSQTAGTNGIAAFVDQVTGTYAITISATGFVPGNRTGYRLLANAQDTVEFFMTAATGGTKVLIGTVTDSSSKATLADVRIALTIQSGGATFVLIDSTNASGQFSIAGIPATVYMGSVAAIRTGYRNYTNTQVTLGQPNQADTARLNIIMVKLPTGIISPVAFKSVSGIPEISLVGAARLKLSNFNENGVVSLFNMNGKLVYRTKIASHATALVLPATVTGGKYIVTITQKNAVYRQQVNIP